MTETMFASDDGRDIQGITAGEIGAATGRQL
jgi:hypothetical protein